MQIDQTGSYTLEVTAVFENGVDQAGTTWVSDFAFSSYSIGVGDTVQQVTAPPAATPAPTMIATMQTTTAGTTAGTTGCSLCPDGSSVQKPTRTVPYMPGENCGELEAMLANGTSELCDSVLTQTFFDVPAWCGCDGSVAPESCLLCGPEGQVSASTETYNFFDGITMDCSAISSFLMYWTDYTACEQVVNGTSSLCCVDATTTMPTASPPTSSPTPEGIDGSGGEGVEVGSDGGGATASAGASTTATKVTGRSTTLDSVVLSIAAALSWLML